MPPATHGRKKGDSAAALQVSPTTIVLPKTVPFSAWGPVASISVDAADNGKRGKPNKLALGYHGGIWTRSWQHNWRQPAAEPNKQTQQKRNAQLVIVAQSRHWAQSALTHALAAGTDPLLVVDLDSTRTQRCLAWLKAIASLPDSPVVLLCWQNKVDAKALVAASRIVKSPVVLLTAAQATTLKQRTWASSTLPSATNETALLAQAVGWCPSPTIELAVATADLLQCGVRQAPGHVQIWCANATTTTEIRQACAAAGVQNTNKAWLGTQASSATKQPDFDLLISEGCGLQTEKLTCPYLDWNELTTHASTHTTLTALAQLQQCAPVTNTELETPPPVFLPPRPWGLKQLDEVALSPVLSAFDELNLPQSQLVTAASGAAAFATALHKPVAVKVVGHLLRHRGTWGGVAQSVVGPAATRQAFSNVVAAARAHAPTAPIRGVLVAEQIDCTVHLDCWIVFPNEQPVLYIQPVAGMLKQSIARPVAIACPLTTESATRIAHNLRHAIAGTFDAKAPIPVPQVKALVLFLRALSHAAVHLAADLNWLHLDTVSLPTRATPAFIVDARAESK